MAHSIGILTPVSGVAYIDTETNVECNMITPEDYGQCFYSTYIDRAAILNDNIMSFISNKNATIWDAICFKQGISEDDYKDSDIMVANEYDLFFRDKQIDIKSLLDTADRFKAKLTPESIDLIINGLPGDWMVSKTDLDSLKRYLLYRLEHLNEICELIIKYKERR